MERKEFIKTCGIACLGGAALPILLQSCSSANYFAVNTFTDNKITISKTEFFYLKKEQTVERKFVLVKLQKFNYPICVYKVGEENFSALLLECTHKGCELHPQPDYLVCPCHGSEFTNTGVVQNPPAERNLQTFKTLTDNENIYVQL